MDPFTLIFGGGFTLIFLAFLYLPFITAHIVLWDFHSPKKRFPLIHVPIGYILFVSWFIWLITSVKNN